MTKKRTSPGGGGFGGRRRDPQDRVQRERSARHKRYLAEAWPAIWPLAHAGYHEEGRGVVYVDSQPDGSTCSYMSSETAAGTPGTVIASGRPDGWLDDHMARMVAEYDPETQLVVVIHDPSDGPAFRYSTYRLGEQSIPPGDPIPPNALPLSD